MIYVCAKCKFLFERRNEPSKCPSCENQCIVAADGNEQQIFRQAHGSTQRDGRSRLSVFSPKVPKTE